MAEIKPGRRGAQGRQRDCEGDRFLGGASCAQAAKEMVDGLLLCERHATEAKLGGQISCLSGILAHVDLWAKEATLRDRPDVVRLLEVQREEAVSALARAYEDLDALRRSEMSTREAREAREAPAAGGESSKIGFLPLPPRGARPFSLGLRRLRRR
jgi:hypothetical protein